MASGPITPILALSAVSYANNWYNTKNAADVKPLLFGALAGLVLELIAAIPGAEPAATALGWTAFIAMLISPVQKPSPLDNFLKISGAKLWALKKSRYGSSSSHSGRPS